jgi:plastocyanin
MRLKRNLAVIFAGLLLVVGACAAPATPAATTPPVTTPPVTTPPATTPPVTTPPVTAPPITTPPATTPPATTPPVTIPPPSTAQGPNDVWAVGGNAFLPGVLTVSVGKTVVWTNKDSMVHTVVSGTVVNGNPLFYGTLAVGGTFSYTFTKTGNYEYQCDIHPGMAGAIHVQ